TAQLCGLGGYEYRDNKTGLQGRDPSNACLPVGPVGRTYRGPAKPLALHDGANAVSIEARAFEDVVVWNPGLDPQFHDLPPDAWRQFLCVEAAQVNRPVTLDSGEQWSGAQRLRTLVSRDIA
ncbi:MAG: D-hexose-6-phosphate mutarotase, partial [Betaproteobacteria bacterium]